MAKARRDEGIRNPSPMVTILLDASVALVCGMTDRVDLTNNSPQQNRHHTRACCKRSTAWTTVVNPPTGLANVVSVFKYGIMPL